MSNTIQQRQLLGKIRINSTLIVETGLHIGGGGETLEIGGIDKPVIRNPITKHPYLPGSSIKGKIRSILERLSNQPLNRKMFSGVDIYRHECDTTETYYIHENSDTTHKGANKCPVCRVFGSTGANNCFIPNNNNRQKIKIKGLNFPASLIVRDAHLTDQSVQILKKADTDLDMTEWKFENSIDRVTAAANPRQLERVPAGAKFDFEMVYTVEDWDHAREDLKNLAVALAILEDDALGGHGSRGYGKIRFDKIDFHYRNLSHYQTPGQSGSAKLQHLKTFNTTEELLDQFNNLETEMQKLLPKNGGDGNND